MNFFLFPSMLTSSTKGWQELEKLHPPLSRVFFLLVLPLSLIPPAMLYLAGTHYASALFQGIADKEWSLISVTFFLVEMITFAGMGWLIKEIADTYKVEISLHDAYLLAAIAPIPLWLSALVLLVPSLPLIAAVSFAALCLSCVVIYHGIYAFCHMREEMLAAGFTFSVMSAGLIGWVILMMLVVLSI